MNIEEFIYQQNPQWLTADYQKPEKDWFYRPIYWNILNFMNKRPAIALTGLRRVGKSTLLNQIKYYLEDKKTDKNHVFFFSFEKSQFKTDPEVLRNILNWYFEVFLKSPPKLLKKKVYIFFDEIQYVPNWQDVIKTFYDLSQNIKFFLSGSSSLFIKKNAVESLAGRLVEIKIPVVSFSEFLSLKKPFFKDLKQGFKGHPNLVDSLFGEYLTIGQFPELIKEDYDQSQANLYLSSIGEKIVEQDIPRFFPVERVDILKLIFNLIKASHSDIFEFKNITNDLGINLKTTIKYFQYLEKSYLINFCYNKTKKLLKSSRSAKKIYLTSTNFSAAFVAKKVENYVFNFFSSLPIWFYRYKNFEVDFVIKDINGFIPVEVKYQEKIDNGDYKNLIKLAKALKTNRAYLISKKLLKTKIIENINLKIIPACLIEVYASKLICHSHVGFKVIASEEEKGLIEKKIG